jgi:hypothetical protein
MVAAGRGKNGGPHASEERLGMKEHFFNFV